MNKGLFLILSLLLVLVLSCSNNSTSGKKEPNQSKSLVEMMNEQAKADVQKQEANKRKLSDLTNEELKQLVSNPTENDRELLTEYIEKVDTEPFHFEPLKAGEKLGYKKIFHQYYKNTSDKISTNEIILYRISSNGDRKEIKHLWRAGHILAEPENTPGYFFFYIMEQSHPYDHYLWMVDGYKGIGKVLLSESGFSIVSNNVKYLFAEGDVKHIFKGSDRDFPVIYVYSISEKKRIKKYDLYEEVKDLLTEDDFLDGLYYNLTAQDNKILAELFSMGSTLPKFLIDQDTLKITRIK